MARDPRLTGLNRIVGLMQDLALADLRRAELAKDELAAQMVMLTERPQAPEDMPPAIAAEIELRFDQWAEARRREVERAWKAKSAECDALRARARLAVGRQSAVTEMIDRQEPRR